MEKFILNRLNWNICFPTQFDFLPRFLQAACYTFTKAEHDQICTLAHYYSQISLHDTRMNRFKCSDVALSCVILALLAYGHPYWSKTLAVYSFTDAINAQLIQTAEALYECIITFPVNLTAVKTKYYDPSIHVPVPAGLPFLAGEQSKNESRKQVLPFRRPPNTGR